MGAIRSMSGAREKVSGEEQITAKRNEDILRARERADEVIEEFGDAAALGEIGQEQANVVMFRSVKRYIRELEPLLRTTETGGEYWEEADIGTWKMSPPRPAELAWRHKIRNGIGTVRENPNRREMPSDYELLNKEQFQQKQVALEGIKSLFQIDATQRVPHTAIFRIRFRGRQRVTDTTTETLPEEIIEQYFRTANRFAQAIKLDVGMKDEIDEVAEPF